MNAYQKNLPTIFTKNFMPASLNTEVNEKLKFELKEKRKMYRSINEAFNYKM